LLALVGVALGAGTAVGAPEHFFRADGFAGFETAAGAFVVSALAGLHDHAGHFVSEHDGESGQAGIERVALVVGLRHVDIASADAAGFDLDQALGGTDSGFLDFLDRQLGVPPDVTAQVSELAFNILGSEPETRLGFPFGRQNHSLHRKASLSEVR
jgi:hypothetical protein